MRQRLAQRLLVFTLALVTTDAAFAATARPPIARRRSGSTTPLTSPRAGTPAFGFHDCADAYVSDDSELSARSADTAIPEDSDDSDTGSCSGHAKRGFMARELALNTAYETRNIDAFVTALSAIKRADDGLNVGAFLRLAEAILQDATHGTTTHGDNTLFDMFDALINMYGYVVGFDSLSTDDVNNYIAHFARSINNMAPPKSARFNAALTSFWPACAEEISATRARGEKSARLRRSKKSSILSVVTEPDDSVADLNKGLIALHLTGAS